MIALLIRDCRLAIRSGGGFGLGPRSIVYTSDLANSGLIVEGTVLGEIFATM